VAAAAADDHITVVPEVLVTGGGGSFEGLAATLMRTFANGSSTNGKDTPPAPAVAAVAPPAAPADAETVSVPTDVEAAALSEEESRPDGSAGGVVTP